MRITFEVTPRQQLFLEATEDEVLFGGAAGGGKSYGQIVDAFVYAMRYPGSRQLILRRTYPELERTLIAKALELYPAKLYRYTANNHIGRFTNGSVIEFGYMQYEADMYNYKSAEYDVIRFDELTQFTERMYLYMFSRLRGANNYPKQIKATTNPGDVGHAWVKARFIDGKVPGRTYLRTMPGGRVTRQRFIPSKVQDNLFLMHSDPGYVARLELLPEKERRALLLGDWDVFSGQVFTEWRNDPDRYIDRRWTHVVEPFAIPAHWAMWRSYDFGYAKPYSVGWYTIDPDGKIYRVREHYGAQRKADGETVPNEGVRLDPVQQAAKIREIERNDPLLKGRRILGGPADPSIFDESRGESIARMMARAPNLVYWQAADNTRMAGKMQCHYRLAFDEKGESMFQVFTECREFIRTVPMLVYDEHKPEDVDTGQEDHIYDEWRYAMMEHPMTPRRSEPPPPVRDDPLNMERDARRQRTQIYRF